MVIPVQCILTMEHAVRHFLFIPALITIIDSFAHQTTRCKLSPHHDHLHAENTEGEEAESGATATIVLARKDKVVVANVGDSRAVLSRNGKPIDLSAEHRCLSAPWAPQLTLSIDHFL